MADPQNATKNTDVLIVGAGPAGLTAAYLLAKKKVRVTVLESDPTYVGGISRTVNYKGYLFDIGGHRFFSKSREVEDFWTEILPDDMLERPRSSRIYYRGKFFSYPLKAFDALLKLGIFESTLCVLSYFKAKAFPVANPTNFEDWVTNQFGKRLFSIFFKTYTEKVWGMSCKEISADWAAQRIKGLSLGGAILNAILPKRQPKDRSKIIKTLIDSFRYPRRGPGMMWEACARKTTEMGGTILMNSHFTGIAFHPDQNLWEVTYRVGDASKTIWAAQVISSAPLRELVTNLRPQPQSAPHSAKLKYRDFLTVALVVKERNLFDDNWIYIHDPSVKVGRIQNYKSWSPEMVPDAATNCYGLEYFCFENDGLWSSTDANLIALAKRELIQLGLAQEADILDGCVVRQKKAYPVYDHEYQTHVDAIRNEFGDKFSTLHMVGRNGMHKYNNQDHAMMTAMLTVENVVSRSARYDVWKVNQDAEYHEAGAAGADQIKEGGRLVPLPVRPAQEQEPRPLSRTGSDH